MSERRRYGAAFRFAWHHWRRRPVAIALVPALIIAGVVLDAVIPLYAGRLVDTVSAAAAGDDGAYDAAVGTLAIMIGIALGHALLRTAGGALWAWLQTRDMRAIVEEANAKVQRFSMEWHANSFAGATVRKITRGMASFETFGDMIFLNLLPTVTLLASTVVVLSTVAPWLGMVTGVLALAFCLVSIAISFWIAPIYRRAAEADSRIGATLADVVTGNATVKAFAAERREEARVSGVLGQWQQATLRAWHASIGADLVRTFLRNGIMGGMMIVALGLWWRGAATAGDITVALTSFTLLSAHLKDVGQHIQKLQRATADLEDVVGFWERDEDIRDAADAYPLPVVAGNGGAIRFEGVRFAYGRTGRRIFDGLDVDIRAGEHVALVGPSGSGKTTFGKLLQRLYTLDAGRIRIDGHDIAGVTQESLRRAIALVPQEPMLFHRSLAENIAYGRPGASREEIVAAARRAHAHDFIEALPEAYDTLVGERGVKLSGGERQRVAIARAILADTPVIILDEATASLDTVSEILIQAALEELSRGRTTITIAHRLATVRKADRILVFRDGRIVEQGSHADLIGRPGSYYRILCETQSLGVEAVSALAS